MHLRRDSNSAKAVRILHVEDDETVAGVVKAIFEEEGWQVESCADGNAALGKIVGAESYDLLLWTLIFRVLTD